MRETWERLYGREGEHLDRFLPSVSACLGQRMHLPLLLVRGTLAWIAYAHLEDVPALAEAMQARMQSSCCLLHNLQLFFWCREPLGHLEAPGFRELVFFAQLSNRHDVHKLARACESLVRPAQKGRGRLPACMRML